MDPLHSVTGMAYALGHEARRAKVQEATAASYENGTEWLRSIATDADLPMPVEVFCAAFAALARARPEAA